MQYMKKENIEMSFGVCCFIKKIVCNTQVNTPVKIGSTDFFNGRMHMQLKFKIEMLLPETRAFPGELKVVYCILHCLSICPK